MAQNSVPNGQPTLALTEFVQNQGLFPSYDGPGLFDAGYLGAVGIFAGSNVGTAALGQTLPISSNSPFIPLFSLYGTTYGGDGRATFGLPNLGGAVSVGVGAGSGLQNFSVGQSTGASGTTLTNSQVPLGGAASQAVSTYQPSLALHFVINTIDGSGGGSSLLDSLGFITESGNVGDNNGAPDAQGQILSVSDNPALFAAIGTTFGGNGTTTFALPDLQGRDVIGSGKASDGTVYTLGEKVGAPTYTVGTANLPSGADTPIPDQQPGLVLNYLIAVQGIYPMRGNPFPSTDGEPVLGQVVISADNAVPPGFMLAQGQVLNIQQYPALYTVLGTTYGGDGQTTFALPNLAGRTVIGTTGSTSLGQTSGSTSVKLSASQLPPVPSTAAPVVTTPSNGAFTNNAYPTYTGVAAAGSTVTVIVDGSPIGTTTATGNGTFTLTQPTNLVQGSHTVDATAQLAGFASSSQSNTDTFTVDTVRPTVTVSSTAGTNGSTIAGPQIPVTFKFSENVTGFVQGDVSVTGGTLSAFSGSGTTYTANVTATSAGPVSVSVAANVAQDAATNGNTASSTFSLAYAPPPPSAPVVTAPANGASTNNANPTYTGTAAAGSTVTLYVDGAAIGTTTAFGGGFFSLTQPTNLAQGSHTVNAAAQLNGSASSPRSNTDGFTVDTVPPTVTVSTTAGSPTSTSPIPFTFSFSEPVSGFAPGEVSVTGGTLSAFSGSGTTYTANITPTGTGTLGVSVAADTAQDYAGNENTASNTVTIQYQHAVTAAPVLTGPANNTFTNTASPTYTGTAAAGSTVTLYVDGAAIGTTTATGGGTFSLAPSGTTSVLGDGSHNAYVTAQLSGESVSLPSNKDSFAVDTVPPGAPVIAGDGSVVGGYENAANDTAAQVLTGTAEANSTVVVFDGNLKLGTTTANGSGSFTFPLGHLADGSYSLTAQATDAAGNTGTKSATYAFTVDTRAPSVTAITPSSTGPTNATSLTETVTFSEPVIGVDPSDFTVTTPTGVSATVGAVTAVAGSPGTYTVALNNVSGDGALQLDVVPNSGIKDLAGNPIAGGFTGGGKTIFDHTPPSVTINDPAVAVGGTVTTSDPIPFTFTFSEPVTGFSASTVAVTNAALSAFSGSGTTYTAIVTPTTAGQVTLTLPVPLGAVQDAVGNVAMPGVFAFGYAPVTDTPSLTLPAGGLINAATPTYAGTAAAGSTVTVTVDNKVIGTAQADSTDGTFSLAQPSALGDGSHTVSVTAQLPNHTVSLASGADTFTVDATAPALASETVTDNRIVLGYTETGSGLAKTAPATADYTVHVGAVMDKVTAVNVDTTADTVTLTLQNAVDASQAVTLGYAPGTDLGQLQDKAGNAAAAFNGQAVNNTTAPAVASTVATPVSGTALKAGDVITFTVNTTAPVTVTGAPRLFLDVGNVSGSVLANYTGQTNTPISALQFKYTVQPGDSVADLHVQHLYTPTGTTIGNANGSLGGNATADTGIQIDTTAPAVDATAPVTAAVNGGPTAIGVKAPTDNQPAADSLAIAVVGLPTDGTVTSGGTAVKVGDALTAAQLTALQFTPTADAAGQTSSFGYTVTDAAGNATAGTVGLNIAAAGTPTIGGTAKLSDAGEAAVAPFAKATLADPNNSAKDTLTIALTGGGGALAEGAAVKNGTLKQTVAGLDGTYTLTGTASAIQAELQALTFQPVNPIPSATAVTTFALTLASGVGTVSAVDKTTVVTDTAAAPPDTGGGVTTSIAPVTVPSTPAPPNPGPVASSTVEPSTVASSTMVPVDIPPPPVTSTSPAATAAQPAPSMGGGNASTPTPVPDPYAPITIVGDDGTRITTVLAPDGTTTTTTVFPDDTSSIQVQGGPYFDFRPYSSYIDRYAADGTQISETRDRTDGSHAIAARSPGQSLSSDHDDTLSGNGQGSTTFVFNPGFGQDTVVGFKAFGPDHDTLSLSKNSFSSFLDVLHNTKNTIAGSVITDPNTGDQITLVGVTKNQLLHMKGDISIH